MVKKIDQRILSLIEHYSLLNADILINNNPINRLKNNSSGISDKKNKAQQLECLKKTIKLNNNQIYSLTLIVTLVAFAFSYKLFNCLMARSICGGEDCYSRNYTFSNGFN